MDPEILPREMSTYAWNKAALITIITFSHEMQLLTSTVSVIAAGEHFVCNPLYQENFSDKCASALTTHNKPWINRLTGGSLFTH